MKEATATLITVRDGSNSKLVKVKKRGNNDVEKSREGGSNANIQRVQKVWY